MPTITTKQQTGHLAADATGKIVECVSIQNWRPSRKDVTLAAWTLLGDGKPRSSILIKNEDSTENIIIAPLDDDSTTHDITDDNSGYLIGPGKSIEPSFTANLLVYARIEAAGGAGPIRVSVVESF